MKAEDYATEKRAKSPQAIRGMRAPGFNLGRACPETCRRWSVFLHERGNRHLHTLIKRGLRREGFVEDERGWLAGQTIKMVRRAGFGLSFAGFYYPAGTSSEIVQAMNRAVVKAMQKSDIVERLNMGGSTSMPLDAKEFAAFVAAQQTRWKQLADSAGIKAEPC